MKSSDQAPKVEALLPVELGRVRYAPGMRAGRWVFATGHLARDEARGVPESVIAPGMPFAGAPRGEREATLIFDRLEAVLAAAGTPLDNVVRVDQFYTGAAAVGHYQRVRRRRFGSHQPASTSMIVTDLVLPEATMQLDAIAFVPDAGVIARSVSVPGLPPSALAPMSVDDFIFIPGQLANAHPGTAARDGLAEEACVPLNAFWGGQPIRTEAEFVLKKRLVPMIEASGSSPKHVLKAQVYLTHLEDIPVFNQVWAEIFGADIPATTIVPSPKASIGTPAARLEVNLVALRSHGATRKSTVAGKDAPAYAGHPAAVKAGDLLFLSGLMANDGDGLIAAARPDPREPYFGASIDAQVECIVEKAEKICAAAGTSLANLVRVQQFHTDLAEFYPTHRVLQHHLGARALPFSALKVPALSIPGCTVMMDFWVYAP